MVLHNQCCILTPATLSQLYTSIYVGCWEISQVIENNKISLFTNDAPSCHPVHTRQVEKREDDSSLMQLKEEVSGIFGGKRGRQRDVASFSFTCMRYAQAGTEIHVACHVTSLDLL